MDKRVCIFCAASVKIDEKYNDAAREVVRALHALNYTIVSGGGQVGTMGAITSESVKLGGRHVAVLPEFMRGLENPGIKEVVWTHTMADRKEKMREGACAAIALPGGIGTVDEFIETHTLKKLHKWDGPRDGSCRGRQRSCPIRRQISDMPRSCRQEECSRAF